MQSLRQSVIDMGALCQLSYCMNVRVFCSSESVPLLVKVIQAPQSREPENTNATENCISAVTKICKYQPSCVNLDEVLTYWLSWLPVWEDDDEAEHVYGYLCELIEA